MVSRLITQEPSDGVHLDQSELENQRINLRYRPQWEDSPCEAVADRVGAALQWRICAVVTQQVLV